MEQEYTVVAEETTINIRELREFIKKQMEWKVCCPQDFQRGYEFAIY